MFEEIGGVSAEAVQRADPFALAAALASVTERQLSQVTAEEAECVVAATQRVINAMAARQAVAVAAFADHAEDAYVRHQEQLASGAPG